ncbi:hypothetical protein B0H17DRAFT_1066715 [Mycena rosella]|uniref:F-box domain-containing protein n=1 Tax=Mycena rosella TaxID=1033263 RepID=A0AAD7GIG9_MYCRO|nr:hypothetical protein B0H17DRAFT_1066715 [Mycena rosella]
MDVPDDTMDEEIKPLCTRRPAIPLNEFPMDTLIHIQSFMDPADIISFRQCSKIMASATVHRTVWMDALRRVCAAHEVSILTYPMENMSLADLEHAATSPARFIAQISKDRAADDLIPAFSTRLFEPRLPKSSSPTEPLLGNVSMMRLIPGGRYLVTSSDTAHVCVWDLGYSPAAVINPYPFVSTVLPEEPTDLLIQPTTDHNGFRFLVYYTLGNLFVEIMVFEFYPAATTPALKRIAKRRVASTLNLKGYSFTQDRFTYHHEFLVTTWDFVEDTCATVHVYQNLMTITASPTSIIAQHAEGIVIVEIPPLHPSGTPAAEAVVEPVTPLPMLSHIHALFTDLSELYAFQADWHSSPDVPLVLDVFGVLVDGSNAYARCLVKSIAGGDNDLPSSMPVLMGVSRVPAETWDADMYGRLHFAGTHLVRTWPTSASIMVNAARVPARRQIEFESKTGWLWENARVETWVYDLDVVSGRLVALAGPLEIRVLDFLLPTQGILICIFARNLTYSA